MLSFCPTKLAQLIENYFQAENSEEEHKLACLLMVFLAVSIPVLARDEGSMYLPELGAYGNSCHCIALAVNNVAAALFTVHRGNIKDRLTEFLAVRLFISSFVRSFMFIFFE